MGLNNERSFLGGIILSLLLVGCAGFSYRYYGLAGVSYERGILLGPTEKEDQPFSKCSPTGELSNPCVIMLTKDFMAFKLDYEDTKLKLKACEKR